MVSRHAWRGAAAAGGLPPTPSFPPTPLPLRVPNCRIAISQSATCPIYHPANLVHNPHHLAKPEVIRRRRPSARPECLPQKGSFVSRSAILCATRSQMRFQMHVQHLLKPHQPLRVRRPRRPGHRAAIDNGLGKINRHKRLAGQFHLRRAGGMRVQLSVPEHACGGQQLPAHGKARCVRRYGEAQTSSASGLRQFDPKRVYTVVEAGDHSRGSAGLSPAKAGIDAQQKERDRGAIRRAQLQASGKGALR